MFRNYLTVAIRNLIRHRVYSAINILGLAIGMGVCVLISLYVKDELSYDDYHREADRIFRIVHGENREHVMPFVPSVLAAVLSKDFPQVECIARVSEKHGNALVRYLDQEFYEERLYRVDSEVFDIFEMRFIKGNPKTALSRPKTVVITEKMARKYFGDSEPVGRSLNIDNKDFEVTGIIKNYPHNTHIKFDFLTRGRPMKDIDYSKGWYENTQYIYVRIKENADTDEFEEQINHVVAGYMGEKSDFILQPIKDIHLYSHSEHEAEPPGNATDISILFFISISVLCIACLNSVNLTTARSSTRIKEVGIRKVVGAKRSQLVSQFLGESILVSAVASLVALALVELALPGFNVLTGSTFSMSCLSESPAILVLIMILLFTSIIAGSYPAFFLSASQPVGILRGTHTVSARGSSLRKMLVICQFALSSTMIIGAIVTYQQLHFVKNKELGFDKERILVLPQGHQSMRALHRKLESIKAELTKHHSVISATATVSVPGRHMYGPGVRLVGEGKQKSSGYDMYFLHVDHDFIDTYNIDLVVGRAFRKEGISDKGNAFIVNEAAVRAMGWITPGEALGKRISSWGMEGEIIGVCEDFHFQSLHRSVGPMVLAMHPKIIPETLSLKLSTEELSETMAFIKKKWRELLPQFPFQYFFLDEYFDRQYNADEKLKKVVFILAGLAVFVACLGLFGLASFTVERRTKEIGVRKVLGASVSNIVFMLTKGFLQRVLVANIIAWPVAFYAMDNWLRNFAYRINLGMEPFVFGGILSLVIALMTVECQALKAATANPVDALRYE